MRKRYIVSGLLGLSAFVYSGDLASSEEKIPKDYKKPSAVLAAKPQQKQLVSAAIPQENQQESKQIPSSKRESSARKLKRKSIPSSVIAQKERISSSEVAYSQQKQIDVVEAMPLEPVAAPIKKKREQPVAAPLKPIEQSVASPAKPVESQIAVPVKPIDKPAVAPIEVLLEPTIAAPAQVAPQEQLATPEKEIAPSSVATPVRKKNKKIAQKNRSVKQLQASSLNRSAKVAMGDDKEMGQSKSDSSSTVPAQAKVITTPTAPIVRDGDNIFFGLEYLIMTTSEGGLSYARQNKQGENHCYDTNFDWNSGFRFGLGYNMGHDRWDLQMVWTWLLTRGNDTQIDTVNQLYATNSSAAINPQSGVLANEFQSHINLHLNLWDTKIGREFFVSKWLTLHPALGVKVGWVNQHWQTTATGDIKALNLTTVTEYKIDMKQKFWGIGPMLGLDSEWGLVENFNLYANGSVALLTGFFNDYRSDIAIQADQPNITNPFRRQSHQPQWVSELQLGLRWNQWMSRNRYRLAFQAGWNAIFLNDHNHLFSISGADSTTSYGQTQQLIDPNGDLMSQGFSVGLRLDF